MMTTTSKHDRARARTRGEQGVTLVELMVAILLAAILSAGLFYFMSAQSAVYQGQMKQSRAQLNLATTLEFLQREIRHAGYGLGCAQPVVKAGAQPLSALTVYNNCNLLTTNPSACPTAGDKADSFSVTHADVTAGASTVTALALAQAMSSPTDELLVAQKGSLQACDRISLWSPDSNACVLLVATALTQLTTGAQSGKWKLDHGAGCSGSGDAYNNPAWPSGGFGTGAIVSRIAPSTVARHFAVDTSVTPPRLVTWTTNNANPSADRGSGFEVVADDIEDMQIAWACDANGDGVISEGASDTDKRSDEWAANVAGDSAPSCGIHPVSSVRVTLVARSASPDPQFNGGRRPAAEDRPGAADKTAYPNIVGTYTRAVIVSTVQPRNVR
ncbi:MAG: PilW family protein [Myxococcales bacterium]|nr:PilW family protein [Myxococcales bacterium]